MKNEKRKPGRPTIDPMLRRNIQITVLVNDITRLNIETRARALDLSVSSYMLSLHNKHMETING